MLQKGNQKSNLLFTQCFSNVSKRCRGGVLECQYHFLFYVWYF